MVLSERPLYIHFLPVQLSSAAFVLYHRLLTVKAGKKVWLLVDHPPQPHRTVTVAIANDVLEFH